MPSVDAMNTREELIQAHVIHEFDRALAVQNITGCYGELSKQLYRSLLDQVRGRRILDVGCGLGLFGQVCVEQGFQVHSIDIDEYSLQIARELFGPAYFQESVYATSLPDGAIDTAVLSDVVCHLDLDLLVQELDRLGVNRIVIHDSNLRNPFLRTYRKATGHRERHDFLEEELVVEMRDRGFDLHHKYYCNILALPLSGGLQRKPVATIGRLPRVLSVLDRLANGVAHLVGLQRRLCFRFVLILDRTEQRSMASNQAAMPGSRE